MNLNKIKHWFYLQKEGIIVGALIGFLLWWRNWNLPFNCGLTGVPKLLIMILIFGGVGALIDAIYEPRK